MNFLNFDQRKKNKIRSLYETKIKELKKENKILKSKFQDKEETLKLNHDFLYNTLQTTLGNNNNNNNIQNLITKCKLLNNKLFSMLDDKVKKEKKVYIIKKEIPTIKEKIKEQIKTINIQSISKNKEILSDEEIIKKLKIELDKIRKTALFKKARTEIKVAPPSKSSVEVNGELINTKKILTKATNLHKDKKKKSDNLWKEEKNLKDEMKKLKNNVIKEKKLKKDVDIVIFMDEIGYNVEVENYDKEEEEESEESEDSSGDDNSDGGKNKNKKNKEKELKNLNEQFNKLKNKIEEYEKKINEYKKTYRELKSKIEEIKLRKEKNKK